MPAITGGVGSTPAAAEAAKRMPYLQSIITIVGTFDLADMGTPLQTRRSFFQISFPPEPSSLTCGSGGGREERNRHKPARRIHSQA